MKKKTRIPLPSLHERAAKLLRRCLAPILLCLAGALLYAWYNYGDPTALPILRELLHSIGISAVLAIGGALLLDCEIRMHE